jgi:hypothetical protein
LYSWIRALTIYFLYWKLFSKLSRRLPQSSVSLTLYCLVLLYSILISFSILFTVCPPSHILYWCVADLSSSDIVLYYFKLYNDKIKLNLGLDTDFIFPPPLRVVSSIIFTNKTIYRSICRHRNKRNIMRIVLRNVETIPKSM